jgi:hypothetical protein
VIALQRRLAEIEILCDLPGASVSIDGAPAGVTPLPGSIPLRPGRHELVLAKAGYKTVRRPFTVAAGERKPFSIRLPR